MSEVYWFRNYFTDRSQAGFFKKHFKLLGKIPCVHAMQNYSLIFVDGVLFDFLRICKSVPYKSVQGPLLFSLYIEYICSFLKAF